MDKSMIEEEKSGYKNLIHLKIKISKQGLTDENTETLKKYPIEAVRKYVKLIHGSLLSKGTTEQEIKLELLTLNEKEKKMVAQLEEISNLILEEFKTNIENKNPVKQKYVDAMNAVFQFRQDQLGHTFLMEWFKIKLAEIIQEKLEKLPILMDHGENAIEVLEQVNSNQKFLEIFIVFFCKRVYAHMDNGIHIVQQQVLANSVLQLRDKFFMAMAKKFGDFVCKIYAQMEKKYIEEKKDDVNPIVISQEDQLLLSKLRNIIIWIQKIGFRFENIESIQLQQDSDQIIFIKLKKRKGEQFNHGMDPDQYQFYKKIIEDKIIDQQRNFYKGIMIPYWETLSLIDYIEKAKSALEIEEMIILILFPESREILMENLNRLIIIDPAEFMLNKHDGGLLSLLVPVKYIQVDHNYKIITECLDLSKLSMVYKFYSKFTDVIPKIGQIMKQYVQREGKWINDNYNQKCEELKTLDQKIRNKRKHEIYLEHILFSKRLFDYIDLIFKLAYQNDSVIHKFCDNGFRYFINNQGAMNDLSIHLITLIDFLDQQCTKNQTDLEKSQIEYITKKIIKYLEDRDKFVKKYEISLGSRLLSKTSKNEELEKDIITWLIQDISLSSMKNCLMMITDTKYSEQITELYMANKPENIPEFSVMILNSHSWPTALIFQDGTIFQGELNLIKKYIETKYQLENPGKKLTFIAFQGTCEMYFQPTKQNKYTITLNTYCATILLVLQTCKNRQAPPQELQEKSQINEEQFAQNLEYLKSTKIIMVNESMISINSDYKNSRSFIKINQLPQQDKINDLQTERERSYQAQAAMVRIMKSRRVGVPFNELQIQTRDLVKQYFELQPNFFKRQIEALIETSYIKRQEDSTNIFDYIP